MKQALYIILFFFSATAYCQVHEVMIADTASVQSFMTEDSVQYFSFSNKKKLNGHWIAFYDEQKQHKAIESVFKQGKLSGIEKQWYKSGKPLSEKICANDTCTTDYFYENGALMRRNIEAIDAMKGTCNHFYSAAYCENGQIKYSPPLNPDSPKAQFVASFYCSGGKKAEFTLLLVSGKLLNTGLFTEWFENGVIKMQGNYDDTKPEAAGKKTGFWNYYNEQGKLTLQERYEDGKLVDHLDY